MRAPHCISTGGIDIRCYQPSDVSPVFETIEANVEHLSRYMDWVQGRPKNEAELLELLLSFRGKHDLAVDFTFGVFKRATGAYIGGAGVHPRCGPGGLEIGYWTAQAFLRQGVASRVVRALTRVGFELMGAERLEIHVEPSNHASRAIPLRCGYTEEGLRRKRLPGFDDGLRDTVAYILVSEDYPKSSSAHSEMAAYDARHRLIPLPRAPN